MPYAEIVSAIVALLAISVIAAPWMVEHEACGKER